MGTRGAYGFRIDNEDKVTYNHFDSYPTDLGKNVVDFVRSTPMKELIAIANKIVLVDGNLVPTDEEQEKYAKLYANLLVSDRSLKDWYCLIRNSQGNLGAYKEGLVHMIDSHEFLIDSLFCEWVYIINMDTNKLEVYKGFNTDPFNAKGRYCIETSDEKRKYYGVSLVNETSISKIRNMSSSSLELYLKKITKLGE